MAFLLDQETNFKHVCKVCKKGFGCGRALGGHMRAHGLCDEVGLVLDDDDDDDNDDYPGANDWDDKIGVDNAPPRMYPLRTNRNRLKSFRTCKNCGEEFLSWKSFLDHGQCTLGDEELYVDDYVARRTTFGWSKRKRSFRVRVDDCSTIELSSEEKDLANCLMMLSNNATTTSTSPVEPEESCASASREDQERQNTLNLVSLISFESPLERAKGVGRGLFECKSCKKVFNSHQALGGHRASHKKVKGCFASHFDHSYDQNLDQNYTSVGHEDLLAREGPLLPQAKSKSILKFEQNPRTQLIMSERKSKVHECSICHRVFSSGQALGGHKRCHWITTNAHDTSSSLSKFQQFNDHKIEHNVDQNSKSTHPLDLNLPINANEFGKVRRDPKNPLSFEVSTEILLPSYDINNQHLHHGNENNDNKEIKHEISNGSMQGAGDEIESRVELAKLGDLKDMNTNGGSSPWLQVGIGSTTIDLGGLS